VSISPSLPEALFTLIDRNGVYAGLHGSYLMIGGSSLANHDG
jgi:hypothetical protein